MTCYVRAAERKRIGAEGRVQQYLEMREFASEGETMA